MDKLTEYQKLWTWANWSWPLLYYEIPNNEILTLFSSQSVLGDHFDGSPGPCEYWIKKINESLYVVIQHPLGENNITVYSNIIDVDLISEKLDFKYSASWRIPESGEQWERAVSHFVQYWSWSVKRLDDNANEFVVATNLHEQGAAEVVAMYEKKGHKQTYWSEGGDKFDSAAMSTDAAT